VTIKPSGRAGTVVSGALYIDTYTVGLPNSSYASLGGDELAALPYTCTIK
jgi:hypothetical protein